MGKNILGRVMLREPKKLNLLNWGFVFFALPMVSPSAQLTKADSGWVSLFNGENFDGLYSRMYGEDVSDQPDAVFQVQTESGTGDPIIHVSPGGGHLGTDAEFSHYRMRVQYRFGDNTGPNDNAGLMYHLTEDFPRMNNNWPRSIECQMRKQETADAFSIQDVTYEVPVRPGTNQYEEGSNSTTTSWSGNHRQVYSLSHVGQNPYQDRTWNDMEIIVRGSERAVHTAGGKKLLELFNIRVPNGNSETPWSKGKIALQAESAEIMYKNWEIMELPENGPDYLHKILVTSPNEDKEIQSGQSIAITWESIGEIENVNIEYSLDDGNNWDYVAENIENIGSHSWTPSDIEGTGIKIRVSAEDYVMAGVAEGSVAISLSNQAPTAKKFHINIGDIKNARFSQSEIPNKIEFYDVSGSLLHSFIPENSTETLYLKNIMSQDKRGFIFLLFKSEKAQKVERLFW